MFTSAVIALLTDFGGSDYFVGVLKGVITSINPRVRIIDITHGVEAFNIQKGAFQLFASYRFFPRGTIFLTVVDPGVGTSRRILLAQTGKYYFISPDNGLLTYVLSSEKLVCLYEVKNPRFFLTPSPTTFEARDKMAPVAAWLSLGIDPAEFGPPTSRWFRFANQEPSLAGEELKGEVFYIDQFGNVITNVEGSWLKELAAKSQESNFFLRIKNKQISHYSSTYAAAPYGKVSFLIGSLGLVEIFLREGSAAQTLGVEVGDEVIIGLRGRANRLRGKRK